MKIKTQIPYLLHYGMSSLVAIGFFLFLLEGNWIDAVSTILIFLMMLAPSLLKNKYKFYLPLDLEVTIVAFIFITQFLGSLNDYYQHFPLMDGIIHFHSGILMGIVGFVLVYILNGQKSKKLELTPGFISFFSVTFAITISTFWEIYEFFADSTFGFNMQESGIPDTMGDLIVNAIGAIIVGVLSYLWMKQHQKLPFTPQKLSGFKPNKEQALEDKKGRE